MPLLSVSLQTVFAKCMHREDYNFEENFDCNTGELKKYPRRYWSSGFYDRRLENQYLNSLAKSSKPRVYLAYGCVLGITLTGAILWVGLSLVNEYLCLQTYLR